MDRENYYKKLAEISLNLPTARNDILTKRFGAPMKKMTYRETCIDYVKKTMRCVGYRDYVVAELEKLDKIEQIVNGVRIDKTITKALAFNKIKEVLEQE